MLGKIFVLLLATLAIALAGQIPYYSDSEAIEQRDSRIIGGTKAAVGQFPYQVLFRNTSATYRYCGGSIVSNRWIITAGHCAYQTRAEDNIVIVGNVNRNNDGTIMNVLKLVLNPKYVPERNLHDIAMVQTVETIQFSPTVQPIGFGTGENIGGNVAAVVSGWGITVV